MERATDTFLVAPAGAIVRTISENKAAAVGTGGLLLVALAAALHAAVGGLTKPLGFGTALLIPMLLPARRRRTKQSDDEADDMTLPPSMPEHTLARSRAERLRYGSAEPQHLDGIRSRTVGRFVKGPRTPE